MAWYPGKNVAKAKAAANRAADKAAEVGRIVLESSEAVGNEARKGLEVAYREAEESWVGARDELMKALAAARYKKELEERARSLVDGNRPMLSCARNIARGLSSSAFETVAKALITPGAIKDEAQAEALTKAVYGSQSTTPLLDYMDDCVLAIRTVSLSINATAAVGVGIEGAGQPLVPVLRHDFHRWLPVPYRVGAIAIGAVLTASAGVSIGLYAGSANEQWGNFVAVTVAGGEGLGGHVKCIFGAEDDFPFEGFEIGGEIEAGSPINFFFSIGRTIRLPLLYPTRYYA